jgi:hypothetical protein
MVSIRPRRLLLPAHQLMMFEVGSLVGQKVHRPFLPVEDLPRAEALLQRFADGTPTDDDLRHMFDHWEVKSGAGNRVGRVPSDVEN